MTPVQATAVSVESSRGPVRMRAHAQLATQLRAGPRGPRTHLTTLRSHPPLALRPSLAKGPEPALGHAPGFARVSLAAAAAGPLGGDHYRLDVHVGAGSTLVLTEVSATLLLPGHDQAGSRTDVRIQLDPAATLVWLPEPVIAAHRCDHVTDLSVDLAPDARLLMREELLLGRHNEPPGRVRQQTRVRRAGKPLYTQDFDLAGPAWATPGVGAGYRAAGSVLAVDPMWSPGHPRPLQLPGHAALMPLADGAVLISALGEDNLDLRRQLETGLAALGPPWQLRALPTN